MATTETVVLNNSDEAAKLVTVTGWVDRHGRFWGDDERMARYCGATHFVCECGGIHDRQYTKCETCRNADRLARYQAMPERPWDGEAPLYSDAADQYFFSSEELVEYVIDEPDRTYESLRLKLCKPNYARQLDGSEYFSDDLPEDGELPDALESAFDALNEVIRQQGPLSWSPVAARPTLDSLPTPERP